MKDPKDDKIQDCFKLNRVKKKYMFHLNAKINCEIE